MPDQAVTSQPLTDTPGKPTDFSNYKEAKLVITKLVGVMDEMEQMAVNNRNLRYTEIDIESERKAGRIAPDELYIPQHIIDTNIRREQATYVSYITQSPRSLVLTNLDNASLGSERLERDVTNKCRYEGWQFPWFRVVDGMQQNAYGIMELVADQTKPGHLALQDVGYGDFGYSLDTRDLQSCEMLVRQYRYTKTQLLALAQSDLGGFSQKEVEKIVNTRSGEAAEYREQSLFKVEKIMFRKKGVVHVGWSCQLRCDEWLRAPRPLYIGRQILDPLLNKYVKAFETNYPYYLVPYTITENTAIKQLKGRAYLDQDYQEGVSSLMSSFVTAHRRASYLVFSKDSEIDPNADVITQSNINFKSGAVINAKVKQFQLTPPDATMLSAIQALATANMQENSQINYAAQNRQDSRKTATEIDAAMQSSVQLSQIQIALFSTAVKGIYSAFFDVVKSRVLAGLIKVEEDVEALYQFNYAIKPAGDVDVIERRQKVQAMMSAWGVMQATPAAQLFLAKLISMLFPDDAPQYLATFQQDDAKTKALTSALMVLQSLVQDPQALSAHEQGNIPQIQALIQQIAQVLQPPQAAAKQQKPPVNQLQPQGAEV